MEDNLEYNLDEDETKQFNKQSIAKAGGKGVGCFLLGVILATSHYAFDLIAAPLGTIMRTVRGCKNLKNKAKRFFSSYLVCFKIVIFGDI